MQENYPEKSPLFEILYEEGTVIAINKPTGVLTQAPKGIDSLEVRVKDYLCRQEQKGPNCYLGIPHRLDRPASGVILFAKNSRAANHLCEQFRSREILKKYWLVVSGVVPEPEGTWRDYMRKVPNRAEAELVPPIHPEAREAVLHYKVIRQFADTTWLEVELETGRTHQIRLQCGSRNFPILGDSQYGSTHRFGTWYEDERERGIALHSRRMVFIHPQTKEQVELVAPLSEDWKIIVTKDNHTSP